MSVAYYLAPTKTCTKCGRTIDLIEGFCRDRTRRDGRSPHCRQCQKSYCSQPHRVRARIESAIRYRDKNPIRYRFERAVQSAKERGKYVDLTPDELMDLYHKQEGRCAITGLLMTFGSTTKKCGAMPMSCSVDRKDQNIGYTISNVRLVCFCVNAFRGIMSDQEMIEVAKAIVRTMENV